MKMTLFCILFGFIISCKPRKPLIELSSNFIELGTISENESKIVPLTIYNRGNDTLKIFNYTCSCGFTVPSIHANQKIWPNDSLVINLTVVPESIDRGKFKMVLCTFKTNSDSIFTKFKLSYTAN